MKKKHLQKLETKKKLIELLNEKLDQLDKE